MNLVEFVEERSQAMHPPCAEVKTITTIIDKISIEAAQCVRANGGSILPVEKTGRFALIASPHCRWSGSKANPLMRLPDGSKIRLIFHEEQVEVIAI